MFRVPSVEEFAAGVGLAAVYTIAGKLALHFVYLHASASAVWPTTGIALAAFLLLGYRIWPAILVGAFLVNLTTAGSVLSSLGIAVGNTLEGVAGTYLVLRFAKGQEAFERAADIFKFTFFAAMPAAAISATLGVTSLALRDANWVEYGPIWRTWWLGDTVGALIVTPLLLIWIANPRVEFKLRRILHAALLFSTLAVMGWVVFGGYFHSEFKSYPLEFLCIPFLIWTAFQFGRREAATAVAALAGIAIWGTLHGFGPFVRGTENTSLLLLQVFMGVMAVMTLALGAEVSERKRAEDQVRRMAVSDPLTGLANYRRLLEVLDAEIKRYGRTERPFAVLLLDLDGLKRVNDTHGHLTGSRALCRLANVLRMHCRETDLAARYGGDEFALVMPETSVEEAWVVAHRIRERVLSDGEKPRLSVSVGAAVYPHDGITVSQLLAWADRMLYMQKRHYSKKGLIERPAGAPQAQLEF